MSSQSASPGSGMQGGPAGQDIVVGQDTPAAQDTPVGQSAGRRRSTRAVVVLGVVLLVLALAYVAAAAVLGARVPAGAKVGDVEVGGRTPAAAVALLQEQLGPRAVRPVDVVVAGAGSEIDPVRAGLELDAQASVDQLVGFDLDPRVVARRLTGTVAAEPVVVVDEAALRAEVQRVAEAVDGEPVEGTVSFAGGRAVAGQAAPGRRIDVAQSIQTVRTRWLTGGQPIELPAEVEQPAVDQAAVQEAMESFAVPAASAPVTLVYAERSVTLEPAAFTPALSMAADEDGALVPHADAAALRDVVLSADPDAEQPPRDASFSLETGAPTIVPSVSGVTLAPDAVAAAVLAAAVAPDRSAVLQAEISEPALTTEAAQALGVVEVVSQFSTNLTPDRGRTENVRIAARGINGRLVRPGEVFSLNEVLGRRTADKGYRPAPVIRNGRLTLGYGGGVSQVATTTFNAVFFAGLADVEHKPHSFYISRYPEGREATISYPTVDLRWRNDSPYGVLVQAWTGDGQLHVRFWSTKVWDIEAERGPRTRLRQPDTIYDPEPGCVSQQPVPGFDVEVRRLFRQGGELVRTETFRTRYNPEDRVICEPEPRPEPELQSEPGLPPPPPPVPLPAPQPVPVPVPVPPPG